MAAALPPLQIPGGWAAQLYGGRKTLIASFVAWSLASLLTPGNASSVGLIVLARVCVGLAQGGLIPSVHTVLSQVSMLQADSCWPSCMQHGSVLTSPTWQSPVMPCPCWCLAVIIINLLMCCSGLRHMKELGRYRSPPQVVTPLQQQPSAADATQQQHMQPHC